MTRSSACRRHAFAPTLAALHHVDRCVHCRCDIALRRGMGWRLARILIRHYSRADIVRYWYPTMFALTPSIRARAKE